MISTLRNILLLCLLGVSSASLKIPFFSKKEYTPLVFFTVPKDNIPECDEMEKTVRQVEKDLGVRVERLNILRDPAAEATLSALTNRRPPFLYNRESLQTISGDAAGDKDRIRSWAKGRFLPAQSMTIKASKKGGNGGTVLAQDDSAIDQADLIEDMTLTPAQKSGKEAMKKRTEELGK